MITKTLINSNHNIKKIYHIADVHIRNLKRHHEYREVFNRLYKYISDTKTDESLIVLVGDIVHAKSDMTPEVIEMTSQFLKSLSDILPTILTPGNHDANLNNPSRLDALSPIVNALNHPNLHYFKESGLLEIGGVTFAHTSVFDDNHSSILSAKDINAEYKIALYHGVVDSVKTEHGFKIENKRVNIKSFDGYDLTLLGDVHVPNQSLNASGTIKYCGSTIMQNHTESKYPKHGILVWDLNSKKSEFVEIENDYGYVTLEIKNGKIINSPYIPRKPRIRFVLKDTTQSQLQKVISSLKTKYKVQEITIQNVSYDDTSTDTKSNLSIYNVSDVKFQNKLISEFLSNKYFLSKNQIDVITDINNEINNRLTSRNRTKNTTWKPIRFEFSNMFSYGDGNIIDFSNLNGTYGIFAANASGKSSLWDALSFCIFDKCSRTSKAGDVLNYSKLTFNCKFIFQLNDINYVIERHAKKSPKSGNVKVNVDFYYEIDGKVHSLNGDDRRDTNSIIRDYVGTYDDFILTSLSNQNNDGGFIKKSQKERKELLAKFLNMDVFEKLHQIANADIKELSTLVKEYKSQNLTDTISNAQTDLKTQTKLLEDSKYELSQLTDRRVDILKTIEKLLSNIKHVDSDLIDIDTLNQTKKNLESKLTNKQIEYDEYVQSIDEQNNKLKSANILYGEFDIPKLKESYTKYQYNIEVRDSIESEKSMLETELEHKKSHLDGIGSLSFHDECEHCTNNKNTPFAKQAKTLEAEIRQIALKILTISDEFDNITDNVKKYDVTDKLSEVKNIKDDIIEIENYIDKLNLKANACRLEISNITNSLENTNNLINKWVVYEKSIEHNSMIKVEIMDYRKLLNDIDNNITDVNNSIIDINGKIGISKNTIDTITKSIHKLENLEKKYDGYELYLQCVRRDGVPYELISKMLPKVESEINNILGLLVDFTITLNTDGKNINSYITYGDDKFWPLELTSGMEMFISSVAIRSALINISNLPRPNFIAIDEGFGSLDVDNFNSLYLLFDYLKTQFDFIVTISHIDKARDMVDKIIDICKIDGFSHIEYL